MKVKGVSPPVSSASSLGFPLVDDGFAVDDEHYHRKHDQCAYDEPHDHRVIAVVGVEPLLLAQSGDALVDDSIMNGTKP